MASLIGVGVNLHRTDIFYCLILPCGVDWTPDQDSVFALTEMKQTVCIYFIYHIWHHLLDISYEESEKCHSSTLEQLFCHKQTIKLSSEPNEQNIQYPITSLIFVVESQSLCLYSCSKGQGSEFVHLSCNWRIFVNLLQCN